MVPTIVHTITLAYSSSFSLVLEAVVAAWRAELAVREGWLGKEGWLGRAGWMGREEGRVLWPGRFPFTALRIRFLKAFGSISKKKEKNL